MAPFVVCVAVVAAGLLITAVAEGARAWTWVVVLGIGVTAGVVQAIRVSHGGGAATPGGEREVRSSDSAVRAPSVAPSHQESSGAALAHKVGARIPESCIGLPGTGDGAEVVTVPVSGYALLLDLSNDGAVPLRVSRLEAEVLDRRARTWDGIPLGAAGYKEGETSGAAWTEPPDYEVLLDHDPPVIHAPSEHGGMPARHRSEMPLRLEPGAQQRLRLAPVTRDPGLVSWRLSVRWGPVDDVSVAPWSADIAQLAVTGHRAWSVAVPEGW